MRPRTSGRILGCLVGFMVVGAGIGLRAGEGPSDKMLASVGLKRVGPVFVLESESAVLAKADEVRSLSRQLKESIARQRTTLGEKEYQATIKELTNELNQYKAQLNATNQSINQLPNTNMYATRRGYYPSSNMVIQQRMELNYYRTQLQAEISQRTTFLDQIRSQPFDPKARIKADNDVRERQEALQKGAQELRKLVEGVNEKYAALGKEPRVKKWLDTPEGPAGVKPKLGPSRTFQLDVKMLEQIERTSSSDEPGTTRTKATRKGRRTKARRATGANAEESPF